MDPLSIFALIASLGGVVDIAVRSISKLSDIKSRYHEAPFAIHVLLGQLCTIQAALDQLRVWSETNVGRHARYDELSTQLHDALACFKPLMMHLNEQLRVHDDEERQGMARKLRMCFVWKEKQLKDYFSMLDAQVNALTLLLNALRCTTWTDQEELLSNPDSKLIIRLATDCSTSVISLRDGISSVLESDGSSSNVDGISRRFEFDDALLQSRVYTITHRSHLQQLVDRRLDQAAERRMIKPLLDKPGYTNLSQPPVRERRVVKGLPARSPASNAVSATVSPKTSAADKRLHMPETTSVMLPGSNIILTESLISMMESSISKVVSGEITVSQMAELSAESKIRRKQRAQVKIGIGGSATSGVLCTLPGGRVTFLEHYLISDALIITAFLVAGPTLRTEDARIHELTAASFVDAASWLCRYSRLSDQFTRSQGLSMDGVSLLLYFGACDTATGRPQIIETYIGLDIEESFGTNFQDRDTPVTDLLPRRRIRRLNVGWIRLSSIRAAAFRTQDRLKERGPVPFQHHQSMNYFQCSINF